MDDARRTVHDAVSVPAPAAPEKDSSVYFFTDAHRNFYQAAHEIQVLKKLVTRRDNALTEKISIIRQGLDVETEDRQKSLTDFHKESVRNTDRKIQKLIEDVELYRMMQQRDDRTQQEYIEQSEAQIAKLKVNLANLSDNWEASTSSFPTDLSSAAAQGAAQW